MLTQPTPDRRRRRRHRRTPPCPAPPTTNPYTPCSPMPDKSKLWRWYHPYESPSKLGRRWELLFLLVLETWLRDTHLQTKCSRSGVAAAAGRSRSGKAGADLLFALGLHHWPSTGTACLSISPSNGSRKSAHGRLMLISIQPLKCRCS